MGRGKERANAYRVDWSLTLSVFVVLIASFPIASGQPISSADFERVAFAALPKEAPYDFIKSLTENGEQRWERDLAATPRADEFAIPAKGWRIVLSASAGTPLQLAAEDLKSYLGGLMKTEVSIEREPSLGNWAEMKNAIVAGDRRELSDCAQGEGAPKDYSLIVTASRIVVCGFDERGAMYGLYNLESRIGLRGAPYFPRSLDVTRHSLYRARFTLSGLGWMDWPDRYLAALPRYGFDSIFVSAYVNPTGEPGLPPGGVGTFPQYWDKWKVQDPSRVHDVLQRAARYGLDAYASIIFLNTGAPGQDEDALRKLVHNIVTQFPTIRGYVLLTEGFAYRKWFGADPAVSFDLKDWARHWVQMVQIASEEAHRVNPNIEILAWEYNVPFRPDQVENKKYIINLLPREVIPLITFENGAQYELDGKIAYVNDYSISQAGPSETAAAQIQAAKARGMLAYSKADTWSSWQFATVPHTPSPQQWFARYRALRQYGIDGTLESWSYGFKPNFVAELRAWDSWTGSPPLEELMRQIARRDYGPGAEDLVVSAWDHFSRAVRLLPDTGPSWATSNAVAAPFFFEKPQPRTMTVEHSWQNQNQWTQTSRLNPYWPFTWNFLFLWPDFTNQVNQAEFYTGSFGMDTYQKYLRLAAGELEVGLQNYRRAALGAPKARQNAAFKEVMIAEQMRRMLESASALLEFEDLRFKLGKASRERQLGMLDRMALLLRQEIVRTQSSLDAALRDSRLGYEWEMDYMYTPYVLQEKISLLQLTLASQLPSYRSRLLAH
ncbi:MAG: hypothetical protein ABSF22_18965 [Bryobacteraceae bacterium]